MVMEPLKRRKNILRVYLLLGTAETTMQTDSMKYFYGTITKIKDGKPLHIK